MGKRNEFNEEYYKERHFSIAMEACNRAQGWIPLAKMSKAQKQALLDVIKPHDESQPAYNEVNANPDTMRA